MDNVCALSERGGGRTVREIITSAREGDQASLNALSETGWWLGLGLASLSPLFSPDTIAVGGGISAAGELLVDSVRAGYHNHAPPEFRGHTRVIRSAIEGWGGFVWAGRPFPR